ncbi:MAG TPA: cation transporter [Gemmatimonas sp.]|nr:cation transporter [Gemmatimonas sp.]
MQTLSLEITGMSCGHCVAAVDKALKALPGVSAANVEIGHATVVVDPTVATPAAIADAVEYAGFSVTVA